jgi:hypothetical protein
MAGMGVLLAGTILVGVVVGAPHGAEATSYVVRAQPTCYACLLRPSIQINSVSADPTSVTVSGANFTPGGPVHVALMLQYPVATPAPAPAVPDPAATATPEGGVQPAAPYVNGQTDTTATLALNLPLGNGQYVHTTGGLVSVGLAESYPACGYFSFWVAATDGTTGRTAVSPEQGMNVACN